MGFVYVDVVVSNPAQPGPSETVNVLVDTGATMSVLPSALLNRLGVVRHGRRHFRAFGGRVTRDTGAVLFTYEGVTEAVSAVFGDDDDPPILGVTALELLGYEVDPVNGRLVSVDMLML